MQQLNHRGLFEGGIITLMEVATGNIVETEDFLLSSAETAEAFGLAEQSPRRWRVTGNGPPYLKDSKSGRISYEWSALKRWAEQTNRRLRWFGEQQ